MANSEAMINCPACKAENKVGARFCRQCGAQIAASASAYDRAKWQALVQYDPDISAAAEAIRPFGQLWVDELGASYMALNDKSYLPGIVEKVTARAKAEKQRQAEIKQQQAELQAAAAERVRQNELERQRSAAARQKQIDEFIALIWSTRDRKIITSAVMVVLAAGLYFLVWYPAPFGVSASPTAFIDQIYSHYRTGSDFRWNAYGPPVDAEVFEPELVEALREDIALNAGNETGWDDANVFCECQDIVDIESRSHLDSSTWTNATVSIDIGNSIGHPSTVLRFQLVASGSEWRIYDIISSSGQSFRDAVMTDLRQSRLRTNANSYTVDIYRDQGIDIATGSLNDGRRDFTLMGYHDTQTGVEERDLNFRPGNGGPDAVDSARIAVYGAAGEPGLQGCSAASLGGDDILAISNRIPGTWFCIRGTEGHLAEMRLNNVIGDAHGINVTVVKLQ